MVIARALSIILRILQTCGDQFVCLTNDVFTFLASPVQTLIVVCEVDFRMTVLSHLEGPVLLSESLQDLVVVRDGASL